MTKSVQPNRDDPLPKETELDLLKSVFRETERMLHTIDTVVQVATRYRKVDLDLGGTPRRRPRRQAELLGGFLQMAESQHREVLYADLRRVTDLVEQANARTGRQAKRLGRSSYPSALDASWSAVSEICRWWSNSLWMLKPPDIDSKTREFCRWMEEKQYLPNDWIHELMADLELEQGGAVRCMGEEALRKERRLHSFRLTAKMRKLLETLEAASMPLGKDAACVEAGYPGNTDAGASLAHMTEMRFLTNTNREGYVLTWLGKGLLDRDRQIEGSSSGRWDFTYD